MKKKQFSIISGATLALVLTVVMVSTSLESEVLVVGLITPTDSAVPAPPSITLGAHGDRVSLTDFDQSVTDSSKIRMAGNTIQLVDVRANNGNVYEYYGSNSPISSNTKLTEFMESGGIIVKTSELRNAQEFYSVLANHEDTKNDWFVANGILAFGYEAHDSIIPTKLDLYTNDGKMVSVWTYATLEDTMKIAEKLELQSGLIDLNDYVDPTWTDGPERDSVEPEPIPEPES